MKSSQQVEEPGRGIELSLFLLGSQVAVCARCFALALGLAAGAALSGRLCVLAPRSVLNRTPFLAVALAPAVGQAPAVHAPGGVGAGLVLAGLAVAGWLVYRVSLWLHPFAMCRRCGGA